MKLPSCRTLVLEFVCLSTSSSAVRIGCRNKIGQMLRNVGFFETIMPQKIHVSVSLGLLRSAGATSLLLPPHSEVSELTYHHLSYFPERTLGSGALPDLRAIIRQYKVNTAGIEQSTAGLRDGNLGSRLYHGKRICSIPSSTTFWGLHNPWSSRHLFAFFLLPAPSFAIGE